LSLRPEFIGKIILLEGYDLALARRLVSGVDVWLNTPEYPLEASGTSGQKAAINGAINLSVLDGWWGEGFNGENGWAITPRSNAGDNDHNREEADDLLDILEYDVMPLYYEHNGRGYAEKWVQLSKASMKSNIPRFNAQRMVMDYVRKFYCPAKRHMARLGDKNAGNARKLAAWKAQVRKCWPGVTLQIIETPRTQTFYAEPVSLRVRANLNGLTADDVVMECVVGKTEAGDQFTALQKFTLTALPGNSNEIEFDLDLVPEIAGLLQYKIRLYPYNSLLSHPFEVGLMVWL
jgi:glycogen phosphorylase